MKSGICPKCSSEEVHRGKPVFPGQIPANAIALEGASMYICFKCGYTETWAQPGKSLEPLKERFKKVKR